VSDQAPNIHPGAKGRLVYDKATHSIKGMATEPQDLANMRAIAQRLRDRAARCDHGPECSEPEGCGTLTSAADGIEALIDRVGKDEGRVAELRAVVERTHVRLAGSNVLVYDSPDGRLALKVLNDLSAALAGDGSLAAEVLRSADAAAIESADANNALVAAVDAWRGRAR